jgi:uncharacterized membrane protein YeiB
MSDSEAVLAQSGNEVLSLVNHQMAGLSFSDLFGVGLKMLGDVAAAAEERAEPSMTRRWFPMEASEEKIITE